MTECIPPHMNEYTRGLAEQFGDIRYLGYPVQRSDDSRQVLSPIRIVYGAVSYETIDSGAFNGFVFRKRFITSLVSEIRP